MRRGPRMSSILPQRSRKFLRHLPVVTTTLLLAVFTACSSAGNGPSSARANTPQTVQVTVAPAQRQDLPIYLTGLGSAAAYFTVNVKSRVDGQLVDVKFREGEFVKKG